MPDLSCMYRLVPGMQGAFLAGVGEEDEDEGDERDEEVEKEVGRSSSLHWNYRGLTKLPNELLERGLHIQEIYLKENGLEVLPLDLASRLPSLSHLYLAKNRLSLLPPDLGSLTLLTTLDLSRNQLSSLPPSLSLLASLHSIDLSHNQFSLLPAPLLSLPSLHYLSLTGNMLHSLPSSLGCLVPTLQGLYLAHNLLSLLPPCLCQCLALRELYVDHNPLPSLPLGLPSLHCLAILSVSHTLLSCLPCLPSISSLRIQAEDCPHLISVPYLTGCQQTLLSVSQSASWAAQTAELQANTSRGVWSVRVWGSGTSPLPPTPPYILLPSGRCAPLPPGLTYTPAAAPGRQPSLRELCLRRLYSLLPSSLSLSLTTTPGLALHLVSLTRSALAPGRTSCLLLPRVLEELLRSGPTTFCCNPACRGPIFQEAAVEVLERQVQRGLAWSGQVQLMGLAAPRLYCTTACYTAYRKTAEEGWEQELLDQGVAKGRIIMDEQ